MIMIILETILIVMIRNISISMMNQIIFDNCNGYIDEGLTPEKNRINNRVSFRYYNEWFCE